MTTPAPMRVSWRISEESLKNTNRVGARKAVTLFGEIRGKMHVGDRVDAYVNESSALPDASACAERFG